MAHPAQYELALSVQEQDIDTLGHVNNLVYLRWVQEVATDHWVSAARPQDRDEVVWVVVRHEIDYVKPALAGDDILARTWVERWRGATSERHTELFRAADMELLARARTVWCALDPESRRPRRVHADTTLPFMEDDA